MVPGVETRHVTARDGTRIGYQVRGDGPCVVLANGLGGAHIAFRHLYDGLERHRTICWDYRGLYLSAVPADPAALSMPFHIDDLVRVLEAEQVDQFAIVGWSMGVQIAFEMLKRHPARVTGMFAINGTPVEYPAVVLDELGRWLDRVPGWERPPASAVEARA